MKIIDIIKVEVAENGYVIIMSIHDMETDEFLVPLMYITGSKSRMLKYVEEHIGKQITEEMKK